MDDGTRSRQCPTCSAWFDPTPKRGRRRTYCSELCQRNRPGKRGHVKSRAVVRPPKVCRWCGTSFAPPRVDSTLCRSCSSRPARTPWRACLVCAKTFRSSQADVCSSRCRSYRQLHWNTPKAKRDAANRRPRDRSGRTWRCKCRGCGVEFRWTSPKTTCDLCASWRERLRESVRFLRATYRFPTRPAPPQACRTCGDPTPSVRATYCSDWCGRVGRGLEHASSPIEYGDCLRCGALFVRRAGRVGAFCSDKCSKRARKSWRKHLERTGRASGEMFTLRTVAERDGWVCHICRKTVPDREYAARPMDPTIDHLIPASDRENTKHALANVALAHNKCNGLRGDRGPAQLLLFG